MARDASGHITHFVVFELPNTYSLQIRRWSNKLTLDILTVFNSSSLNDIEKLLVCCPICTVSPIDGAHMSFVMARMFAQLSMRASAAAV